ncbi:succinylglutamate desuccinylase [Leeia oryzae]|uniref:succinylglutamate desuccinylase n=1 Tax=Leeia oryzae TaxID=356662 RepID=UPI000369BECD|nr:succinylglutamate desuccinylase [Leeia oryzae]
MHQIAPNFLKDFLNATLTGNQPDKPSSGALPNGASWHWIGEGALVWQPANPSLRQRDIVISSGVHGDETAPIEVCNQLIQDLAAGNLVAQNRILFLFGNLPAMRAAKRYLDDDLNRLFSGKHATMTQSREAPRAAQLENWVKTFFEEAPPATNPVERLHLDLHTAIRGSRFARFAVAPYKPGPLLAQSTVDWLQRAEIDAVLLNAKPAGTFSYFTSNAFQAKSLTLELGKVRPFGQNDLSQFAGIHKGLQELITGDAAAQVAHPLHVFQIAGEIERRTVDNFQLHIADDVENFTPFAKGTVLAEDENYQYVVQHEEERIVFPNRTVKPGLRAGLMVVETRLEQHVG